MKDRTRTEQAVQRVRELERSFNDTVELVELAEGEGDEGVVRDALAELLYRCE